MVLPCAQVGRSCTFMYIYSSLQLPVLRWVGGDCAIRVQRGGVEGGAQVGGWLRRVCLILCLGENKRDERKEIPVNEETLLLL